MADNFRAQVLNANRAGVGGTPTPVVTLGSVTFMYLRHNDIYVLGVTRNNANAMVAFTFMTSVRRTCWHPSSPCPSPCLTASLAWHGLASNSMPVAPHAHPAVLPPPPSHLVLLSSPESPLPKLLELLRSYFGVPVTEAAVKSNFVLIYELLEEAMDYGLPQISEPAALKGLILQRGARVEGLDAVRGIWAGGVRG